MKTLLTLATLGLALTPTVAGARIVTKTIDYTQNGVTFEGYLAYDDASQAPRPGVLIFHQWMGLTDYEKMRAEKLAKLGYVAFAADVYGKGVRPTDTSEAQTQTKKFYADRAMWRQRGQAALAELLRHPQVDPAHVAAIGYCFGGGSALELARSGADLVGVVTFHGTLSTPTPEDAKNIKAKVLICHGADDPYVPLKDVHACIEEMKNAGVDYEVALYGGAVHAFTQPGAGDDPSQGAAYNAEADHRSWQLLQDFFAEIFP